MKKQTLKAQLIKTDGTVTEITPANGRDFKLQECYNWLGCDMVELVHLADGRIMLCDEESKLKNDIQINKLATELFRNGRDFAAGYKQRMQEQAEKSGAFFIDAGMGDDELDSSIAGDVIVCSKNQFR